MNSTAELLISFKDKEEKYLAYKRNAPCQISDILEDTYGFEISEGFISEE